MLPDWLRSDPKHGCFLVDPDIIYVRWAKDLGLVRADLDQYWLEVLFQCSKMDAQHELREAGLDPRVNGDGLRLRFLSEDGRKERWTQRTAPLESPAGQARRMELIGAHRSLLRGAAAASQGGEAREHYRRVRGFLPA